MSKLIASKNAALEPAKRAALQQAIDATEAAAAQVPGFPQILKPVQVAQFLLESNWGHADMGAHNYFGIKARAGEPTVQVTTHEVEHGVSVKQQAGFRKFASMAECFAAHADLLVHRMSGGQKLYHKALACADPSCFANALTGLYATDPQYGAKLISIMKSRGLLETFGFAA